MLPLPQTPKVLLLRGWFSSGFSKTLFLRGLGYNVEIPQLSDLSFRKAQYIAQEAVEKFNPDIIIGASRGGAVAMNIEANCPKILMCPAYKYFGNKEQAHNSYLIHSLNDDMIPYAHSVELSGRCELPLFTGGKDHRLNCQESKDILRKILKQTIGLPTIQPVSKSILLPWGKDWPHNLA